MADRGNEPVRSGGRMIATLQSWSREPLLQFLLLGLALFAGYHALNPDAGKRADPNRIVITEDDVRQLQVAFMAQWRRQPTQDELGGLLRNKVREEVLFREAMALGLDRNDTIIKRRLAQKMEFLADDVAALTEPTTEQLKAFFQENAARFAAPGLVSFRHLYFSTDQRGGKARDDAAALFVRLSGAPSAEESADPFMYKDAYAEQSGEQVA